MVGPLPHACELHGVPFVAVDSKAALGKACKLPVNVAACCVFARRDADNRELLAKLKGFLA